MNTPPETRQLLRSFRSCDHLVGITALTLLLQIGCSASGDGSSPRPTPSDAGGSNGGTIGSADGAAPGFDVAEPRVLERRLRGLLWGDEQGSLPLPMQLSGDRDLPQIATKMLASPAAAEGIRAFVRWWLDLPALLQQPKPDGLLDAELRLDMSEEAPETAVQHILGNGGDYETLMTGDAVVAGERLRRHYGDELSRAPNGTWKFGTKHRAGLLMGAGVLTRFAGPSQPTWPARRYGLIWRALLCADSFEPLTAPQVGVPAPDPSLSLSEQMTAKTAAPTCMVCHKVVNPIGNAFAMFNTAGAYASGTLATTAGDIRFFSADDTVPVTDGADLIRKLSARESAKVCFVRQLFSYVVAKRPNPPPRLLQASVDEAMQSFRASGWNIPKLLTAITKTPVFTLKDEPNNNER